MYSGTLENLALTENNKQINNNKGINPSEMKTPSLRFDSLLCSGRVLFSPARHSNSRLRSNLVRDKAKDSTSGQVQYVS